MKAFIQIIAFYFIGTSAYTQHLSQQVMTLEDGLPHTEVYGSFYMNDTFYFQSGPNIVRYDGYEMDAFSFDEIGATGFMSYAKPLKKGYLLFLGQNYPLYYRDGKWSVTKLNINRVVDGKELSYARILKDSTLYRRTSNNVIYRFDEDSLSLIEIEEPIELTLPNPNQELRSIEHDNFNDSYELHYSKIDDQISYYAKMNNWEDTYFQYIGDYIKEESLAFIRPIIFENEIFILSDHHTITVLSEHSKKEYDLSEYLKGRAAIHLRWLNGTEEKEQLHFYLSTKEDGKEYQMQFLYKEGQFRQMGRASRQVAYHNQMDPMDNVWVGSHTGLKKENPYIVFLNDKDADMANALHTIVEDGEGRIWLGGYTNGFATYNDFTLKKVEKGAGFPNKILPSGLLLNNGSLFFITEEIPRFLFIEPSGKWHQKEIIAGDLKPNNHFAGYYTRYLNDGQIAIGLQHMGLGIVDSMDAQYLYLSTIGKEKGVDLINVLHFTQDGRDRIWMGRTSTGVALYDMDRDTAWTFARTGDNPASFGTISGAYDDYGSLWLGSNRGLYVLDNASDFDPETQDFFNEVKFINLPDGDNRTIPSMTIHDDMLYFGGQTALNMLDLKKYHEEKKENPWIYQLRYGEDINGGGSEQNTMMVDSDGFLWLGSQEGASRIDIEHLPIDTTRTKINFKNIRTGKGALPIYNEISIPSDSRNLHLTFGLVKNPSLMRNTFFDYDLISSDGDTIQSGRYDRDGKFELNYLPPDTYQFNVIAKKHNQVVDKKSIEIHVPLSLTENPLTWITLITFIFGGLFGFLTFRNRQKQKIAAQELKLSKLENEKDNLQVQSIISSFNPHFINNSLHWAQSKYRKDPEMTQMIDALSKNIKYIFSKTRNSEPWHSLQKELELVDNYVQIQYLRFGNSFRYIAPDIANLDPTKRIDVLIMQIQIHVENAIEHGLKNRKESTYVKVEVSDDDHNLILLVEDDGCGRKKAQQIKSMGTQQGVSMLKSLHKIYNSINDSQLSTVYHDEIYKDDNGVHYGTRVEIKVPKQMNRDLKS